MACKWCCILGHCCIPSAVSHDAGHLVKTCQEEVYLQPVVDPEWSLVLLHSVVACQFRIVIKPHSHTTIKCEQDLKRMWQHIDSNSYSLPLADISHSIAVWLLELEQSDCGDTAISWSWFVGAWICLLCMVSGDYRHSQTDVGSQPFNSSQGP